MTDNSIGIIFWILAFAAVVSAVGAVTLKKTAQVFLSLGVNIFTVAGLLSYLGFTGFAFLYFAMALAAAVVLYFVFNKKINSALGICQIETHSPRGWYFITALLIFSGCLTLIAKTEVWQYAAEDGARSFAEFGSILKSNYSLLMIVSAVFIVLLVFIMATKFRPRNN